MSDATRNMRDRAVALAQQGFKVFPLAAGTKDKPVVPVGWPHPAKGQYFDQMPSSDPHVVFGMWTHGGPVNYNVGICTNDLLVIDIDNKNGKDGNGAALKLLTELEYDLNATLQARTPTGGRHLFYKLSNGGVASNTASKLGEGLDTRGWHGYVVAPGSVVPAGEYKWDRFRGPDTTPMATAPEALLARVAGAREKAKQADVVEGLELDSEHAIARAVDWLTNHAPEAIENVAGDFTTFKVACSVADMGISEPMCLGMMWDHWNPDKAHPPWSPDELEQKIANAYSYRQDPIGISAPEAQFSKVDLKLVPPVENEADGGSTMPPLTLARWAERDLPEPEFICGQWLTTTSRVIVNAPTGLGKSMFTMGMGMAIAAQKDFLHWKAAAKPFRVLYIDGEMSNRLLKKRLAGEVQRLGCAPETFYALSHEDITLAPLNTPQGQKQVEAIITALGGIDLIQFDNVMSLIPGDQKEEEGWARVLPWIRSLTRRSIGQMWVHHTGLNKTHGYGTSTREWQLDTVMHLTAVKRSDTDISFEIEFPKARERDPTWRQDFATKRIVLLRDQWSAGTTVDFEPQLTNGDQDRLDQLKTYTSMLGLEQFTTEDMLLAWKDNQKVVNTDMSASSSMRTVRRHADTLTSHGHLRVVSETGAKTKLYSHADNADTTRTTDSNGVVNADNTLSPL